MRTIVLASHGELAAGMKSSVEMVTGAQENLHAVCAYTGEVPDPRAVFDAYVAEMSEGDELVLVTDVLGGSVNNEASQLVNVPGVYVATGMNLPFVLSLVIGAATPIQQLIDQTLAEIPAQVVQVKPHAPADEEDF